MNRSMIRYILGWVLVIEAALMLLPCLVAVVYQEKSGFCFVQVLVLCAIAGGLLIYKKPKNTLFYLKEGCVTTALCWVVMSIFGALPFVFSGEIPSFTDAMFETISGFTTTGASVLSDVESMSYCMIFWRSFTHWIGGMGVLVFLLAVLPMGGGSRMNLMRAESPGPSVGKLVPKVRYTARILYYIYIGITIIQIILMYAGGIPLFDALTLSFGTVGTGGFGIKNDSMAGYSGYIQWITTIFMILCGINFNAYYYALQRKWKQIWKIEEVRWYLIIIIASAGFITYNAYDAGMTLEENIRHAFFQVGSIITTTGYSTVDFDLWPAASRTIIVLLMFIGACAGSTGGGIKVSRFVILFKSIGKEIRSYLYPKKVETMRMDEKPLEKDVISSVGTYFMTYIIIFAASVFLVSLEGKDLVTNFTAVAATFNNIGPGLAMAGPTQNFGGFTLLSKWVMIFDMLAGRLELFPMIMLFHPAIWKQMARK